MNDAGLHGLVESGIDVAQRLIGFGILATGQKLAIVFFKIAEARRDAAVVHPFALAVAHPAFG